MLEGVKRFIAQGTQPGAIDFFARHDHHDQCAARSRGANVGVVITRGYRAIQEIQQQARDGNPATISSSARRTSRRRA